MKRFSIFLIVCMAALLAACNTGRGDVTVGSGHMITEPRKVSAFKRIELSCSADVIVAQSGSLSVSVEGEDNLAPMIEISVSGDTLSIKARPNSNFRVTQKLVVNITMPEVIAIQVSGSGDVDINGLSAGDLGLDISGSGNIHIHYLQAASVTASISGSGDITLDGKTDSQEVKISGSGDYKSSLLESRLAHVVSSGSGDATVWATFSLTASLSGSGDVNYYGIPGLTQKATGSGSVEKIADRP